MRLMFDEVRKNKRNSILLISLFIVMIGLLGGVLGLMYDSTYFGVGIALFISLIYIVFSYYSGSQMILGLMGAREVTKAEFPYLFHTTEAVAIAAGIPTPRAYVIDDSALNAFATGRDPTHAAITVTTGLMEKLDRQELEAVVAHEMSHIKNYDIRFMMLVTMLIGIVTLLSDFILRSFLWGGKSGRSKDKGGGILIIVGILFAILTPIIGQMIKFAISRQREFLADSNAAVLTRYPPALASALEKIKGDPDPLVDKANKATAHLFISIPFRPKEGFLNTLFATHPPIDERIERLKEM